MRINNKHTSLSAIERGKPMPITVNGVSCEAYAGESVATVLLAEGIRVFRRMPATDEPRGMYCGIGICYECLVTIDGIPNVRACVTEVREGMVIRTGSRS